ncbi:hypothetical protein GOP47_0027416 [Adiantum capillus-veneris]|nr:hypothetical protein GOP47_0027416 [Adiantum capillus-veneris]
MASRHEKEKGVNVQVLLRCRPFNDEELRSNAPQVVTCHDLQREVAVSQNIAGKQLDRVFTFDKVFGTQSQQKDLYDQAIVPIVNEVLEGFNCTIFAYGQTGTGKTYTMEGAGRNSRNGELPPDAGVIPRAIKQIFDTLELQNAEYSVKVTFLELYNEETTDLLAPEDISKLMDDKRKPLSLMEDGKGGVIVRGLEEVIVTNSVEIFNLLDRGSSKRRTAETLLNKQSSRSHSIFSITIHIKEATPEGEELIKCGKLNLVDLAGSENICRSGAREGRAREAGEINKSLLTLGRVITSLVEHLGHVPYRDSKLTRLLRDSLGGRTKTCIIATVSPSVHCLEETLSTLDYAQRAKSIKNKPEVNQKLMKTTLIKELYGEIDRLKTELHAAREKNGVYIPRERYYQDEADKKAMAERMERVEEDLACTRKLLEEMQARYESEHDLCNHINAQLDLKQQDLEVTKQFLLDTKEDIKQASTKLSQKDFVISSQQQSEAVLLEKTTCMRSNFEQTVQDVTGLFSKLERKKQLEAENMKVVQSFQSELLRFMAALRQDVTASIKQQQEHIFSLDDQIQAFMETKGHSAGELKLKVEDLKLLYFARLQGLFDLVHTHENDSNLLLDRITDTNTNHGRGLQDLLRDAVLEAELVLQDLECTFSKQQNEVAAFAQQQREGAHSSLMAIKELSKSTFDAFDQLGKYNAELSRHIDDCSLAQERSLVEFEKIFEEQARREEQQMLQEIATLFAKTKAQKSALVHDMVSTLREQSASERSAIQDGMNKVTNLACTTHSQWEAFVCQSEVNSAEDIKQLAARHCEMEALMQTCMKGRDDATKQWKKAEYLVEQCNRMHLPVTESIVRESKEASQQFQERMKQNVLAAELEVELFNGSLLAHTLDATQHDMEIKEELQYSISSQVQGLATLRSRHHTKVEELQRLATGCFENIKEDLPTNLTPKRRQIHVPSMEELRVGNAENVREKYREQTASIAKENGVAEPEHFTIKPSHRNEALPTRIPLARLN